MASVLTGFLVRLGFDVDKDGMQRFKNSVDASNKSFKTLQTQMLKVGVALGAVMSKNVWDASKSYAFAKSVHSSVLGLEAMQKAASRSGGSVDAITNAFTSLHRNIIENTQAVDAFLKQRLGVDLMDANGKVKDTSLIFGEIREKLVEINKINPTEARAIANVLGLGDAFNTVINTGFGTELARINRMNQLLGKEFEANAEKANRLTTSLSRIWDAFWSGSKSVTLGALDKWGITEALEKGAGKAEKWGLTAVKWFKDTKYDHKKRQEWELKVNAQKYIINNASGEYSEEQRRQAKKTLDELLKKEAISFWDSVDEAEKEATAVFEDANKKAQEQYEKETGKKAKKANENTFKGVAEKHSKDYTEMDKKTPLGVRNFNPGNLRSGVYNVHSLGKGEGGFVRFATMGQGVQALATQLKGYASAGADNIASIIRHWAPPNENNTEAYIKSAVQSVSRELGTSISATDRLDLSDPRQLLALTRAIVNHENGRGADKLIGLDKYMAGIELASKSNFVSGVIDKNRLVPSTGQVVVNQTINVDGTRDPQYVAQTIKNETSQAVYRNSGTKLG